MKNPSPSSAGQSVGLAVSELSDAQKKELKVKGWTCGLTAAVEAAARAGLREGDMSFWRWQTPMSRRVKEFEAAHIDQTRQIQGPCRSLILPRGV
jgi:serine protease Do